MSIYIFIHFVRDVRSQGILTSIIKKYRRHRSPIIWMAMSYYNVFSTFLPLCLPLRYPIKHFSSAGFTTHINSRDHFSPIKRHGKICQLVKR